MSSKRRVGVVLSLTLLPWSVAAQGTSASDGTGVAVTRRGGLVGLGVVTSVDGSWGTAKPLISPGLVLMGGLDLTRHVRLRVELDAPGSAETTSTFALPTYRSIEVRRQRAITLAPLLDVHGALASRVELGLIVGAAGGWREERVRIESDALEEGVWVHREASYGSTSASGLTNLTLGTDVTMSLTPRLGLAATTRLMWLPFSDFGSLIVRPGVSLRWRF